MPRERQRGRPTRGRDLAAENHGEQEAGDADDSGLADVARPQAVHVEAHEEREGDGGGDREHAPRAFSQCVDEVCRPTPAMAITMIEAGSRWRR